MATVSFDRNLVITSDEEAQRMLDAIEEADMRGPESMKDFSAELEAGEEFVKRGYKGCRTP